LINGVISIRKEKGWTSFDVVAKLRGILKQKKIGHTGTLDPDAEGVLLVCLGKATKLCDILPDKDKEYEATLLLGVDTDTEDISGKVLNTKDVISTKEEVEKMIMSFLGESMQIPPMYSAIKVNGKKLYELAREGKVIEREPRKIIIYRIEIISIELPRVVFKVECSKGTYIRSLCRDIGNALGCGGCMEHLLRSRACGFDLSTALSLEEVEEARDNGSLEKYIISIDSLYPEFPKILIKEVDKKLIDNGNKFTSIHIEKTIYPTDYIVGKEENSQKVLVYDHEGNLYGIYSHFIDIDEYKPYKMFI